MRILGRCARGFAQAVAVLLLAPVLALLPAALLDRGPGGAIRPTLFPAGLAASDPFLWTSTRNSLANAAIVTIGALGLGVALARILARWRFWGRTPLAIATITALAVPPVGTALGLRLLFGPSGPWRGAWTETAAQLGFDPHGWAWVALAWTGLASGIPFVALATARALARVEPAWEDAARQAGAGRRRVWRTIVRPMVRAQIAGAGGVVFGLTLIEPSAPLLLGLRRTLAFQIVDAALGPDAAPRAAVLATAALGSALLAHALLQWWGGEPAPLASRAISRLERAGPWRGPAFALILGASALFLWLPALGVCGTALTPPPSDSGRGMRLTLVGFTNLARDVEIQRLALHSVALGAGAVAIGFWLTRTLPRHNGTSFLAEWPEAVPPLTLGVGALMLPTVLAMAATATGGGWGTAFQATADLLDPYRMPGILLLITVAAMSLSLIGRSASSVPQAPRDAARQLGLARNAARRLASERTWQARLGPPVQAFVLAASTVAPAIVLTPTSAGRTLGPGLLILAEAPGDGLHQAATLGACLIALNVAAFALGEPFPGRLEPRGDDPVY